MKKSLLTLLIMIGLTLIVVGISIYAFPAWRNSAPGGLFALFGLAFLTIAGLGSNLEKMRSFLFPVDEKKIKAENSQTSASPSIKISGNTMVGRNKMNIRREGTEISDNKLLGKNEIEVGAKPGPRPKNNKQK